MNSTRQLGLIVVIAIAVLAVISITLLIHNRTQVNQDRSFAFKDYRATAETFIRALVKSDSSSSFDLMSSQLQQDVGGKDAWKSYHDTAFGSEEVEKAKRGAVTELSASPDPGVKAFRFIYKIEFQHGLARPIALVVRVVEGSLQVDGYDKSI